MATRLIHAVCRSKLFLPLILTAFFARDVNSLTWVPRIAFNLSGPKRSAHSGRERDKDGRERNEIHYHCRCAKATSVSAQLIPWYKRGDEESDSRDVATLPPCNKGFALGLAKALELEVARMVGWAGLAPLEDEEDCGANDRDEVEREED